MKSSYSITHFLIFMVSLFLVLNSKGQNGQKTTGYYSTFQIDDDESLKKTLNADLIVWGHLGGDGMRMVRNKKTQKWGIYQIMGDDIIEFIPMEYDSLRSFEQNSNFTVVYNSGKIGIYLARWTYGEQAKESVPCQYEDYRIFDSNDYPPTTYLAVKNNGKWAWIDWFNNDLKSGFLYNTPSDLLIIGYEQNVFFEEVEKNK